MDDSSALLVEADGKQLIAALGRGRDPDLAAQDHGGGPGAPVDRGLPTDILPFAPRPREVAAVGDSRAVGTTELRPLAVHGERHHEGGGGEKGCLPGAPPIAARDEGGLVLDRHQALRAASQAPRVKSGNWTRALPFATDSSLSRAGTLQGAASYTSISGGRPLRRHSIRRQLIT